MTAGLTEQQYPACAKPRTLPAILIPSILKTHPLLIISVLLLSCKVKGQITPDKAKVDKLFKESLTMFKTFLDLKIRNSDSARIINKQLIDKYEKIYQTDPTDKNIGHFLASSYYYDKQYSKSLSWFLEQLRHATYYADIGYYNEGVALCHIALGQLDSAKLYLQKAIDANKLLSLSTTLSRYKQLADDIYYQVDNTHTTLLVSKQIVPCQYAIDLLNYMLPVAQKYLDPLAIPFNTDTISLRQKNCR